MAIKRRKGKLVVAAERVSRKALALDLVETLARMSRDGECPRCETDLIDSQLDATDTCPKCGVEPFQVTSEDAIDTLNRLIAEAREITGHSPRKDKL